MVMKKIMNSLSSMGKNSASKKPSRREHPRLKVYNLIKFTTSDGTRYESISNILNLSESGLQFTMYEELTPGQNLKMVIHIPDTNKEVPVNARLVWNRKSRSQKGVFVVGVKFIDLKDEYRDMIRTMVKKGRHTRRQSHH